MTQNQIAPDKEYNDLKRIDMFHELGMYIPQRIIYFGSEYYIDEVNEAGVDFESAKKLIKNLLILDDLIINSGSKKERVSLILNNPGGDWHHGMAIYDFIKRMRCKVDIYVYGMCMSMASIILQAGTRRFISPNSKIMIHDGSDGFYGYPRSFEAWGEESKKIREDMYKIYLKRIKKKKPKIKLSDIEAMCSKDNIFDADRALEYNLVDEIT